VRDEGSRQRRPNESGEAAGATSVMTTFYTEQHARARDLTLARPRVVDSLVSHKPTCQ
jgi:hypothetical protein